MHDVTVGHAGAVAGAGAVEDDHHAPSGRKRRGRAELERVDHRRLSAHPLPTHRGEAARSVTLHVGGEVALASVRNPVRVAVGDGTVEQLDLVGDAVSITVGAARVEPAVAVDVEQGVLQIARLVGHAVAVAVGRAGEELGEIGCAVAVAVGRARVEPAVAVNVGPDAQKQVAGIGNAVGVAVDRRAGAELLAVVRAVAIKVCDRLDREPERLLHRQRRNRRGKHAERAADDGDPPRR